MCSFIIYSFQISVIIKYRSWIMCSFVIYSFQISVIIYTYYMPFYCLLFILGFLFLSHAWCWFQAILGAVSRFYFFGFLCLVLISRFYPFFCSLFISQTHVLPETSLSCIIMQLHKPKEIRLGNWEKFFLSKGQLDYAATDAFASWYLYKVISNHHCIIFL